MITDEQIAAWALGTEEETTAGRDALDSVLEEIRSRFVVDRLDDHAREIVSIIEQARDRQRGAGRVVPGLGELSDADETLEVTAGVEPPKRTTIAEIRAAITPDASQFADRVKTALKTTMPTLSPKIDKPL